MKARKILAIILALCMIVPLFPTMMATAEEYPVVSTDPEFKVYDPLKTGGDFYDVYYVASELDDLDGDYVGDSLTLNIDGFDDEVFEVVSGWETYIEIDDNVVTFLSDIWNEYVYDTYDKLPIVKATYDSGKTINIRFFPIAFYDVAILDGKGTVKVYDGDVVGGNPFVTFDQDDTDCTCVALVGSNKITVTPDQGYEVGYFSILDEEGNDIHWYTKDDGLDTGICDCIIGVEHSFIATSSKYYVSVTFAEIGKPAFGFNIELDSKIVRTESGTTNFIYYVANELEMVGPEYKLSINIPLNNFDIDLYDIECARSDTNSATADSYITGLSTVVGTSSVILNVLLDDIAWADDVNYDAATGDVPYIILTIIDDDTKIEIESIKIGLVPVALYNVYITGEGTVNIKDNHPTDGLGCVEFTEDGDCIAMIGNSWPNSITTTPAEGYKLKSLIVNGEEYDGAFVAESTTYNVTAEFIPLEYEIAFELPTGWEEYLERDEAHEIGGTSITIDEDNIDYYIGDPAEDHLEMVVYVAAPGKYGEDFDEVWLNSADFVINGGDGIDILDLIMEDDEPAVEYDADNDVTYFKFGIWFAQKFFNAWGLREGISEADITLTFYKGVKDNGGVVVGVPKSATLPEITLDLDPGIPPAFGAPVVVEDPGDLLIGNSIFYYPEDNYYTNGVLTYDIFYVYDLLPTSKEITLDFAYDPAYNYPNYWLTNGDYMADGFGTNAMLGTCSVKVSATDAGYVYVEIVAKANESEVLGELRINFVPVALYNFEITTGGTATITVTDNHPTPGHNYSSSTNGARCIAMIGNGDWINTITATATPATDYSLESIKINNGEDMKTAALGAGFENAAESKEYTITVKFALDGGTPDPDPELKISVVDGYDGWTPVITPPVVEQILAANIVNADTGALVYGTGNPAVTSYKWYYKGGDTILGIQGRYTVTTDNIGGTICVDVVVDGHTYTWEAAGPVIFLCDCTNKCPACGGCGIYCDCGGTDCKSCICDPKFGALVVTPTGAEVEELREDYRVKPTDAGYANEIDIYYIEEKCATVGSDKVLTLDLSGLVNQNSGPEDDNDYSNLLCADPNFGYTIDWDDGEAFGRTYAVKVTGKTTTTTVMAQLCKNVEGDLQEVGQTLTINLIPVAKFEVNITGEGWVEIYDYKGYNMVYADIGKYGVWDENRYWDNDDARSNKPFTCIMEIVDGVAQVYVLTSFPNYVKSFQIDKTEVSSEYGDNSIKLINPLASKVYTVDVVFDKYEYVLDTPVSGEKVVEVVKGTPTNEKFNFKMEFIGAICPYWTEFYDIETNGWDYYDLDDYGDLNDYIYGATKTGKGDFVFDIDAFFKTDLFYDFGYYGVEFIFRVTESKGSAAGWTYDEDSVYYVGVYYDYGETPMLFAVAEEDGESGLRWELLTREEYDCECVYDYGECEHGESCDCPSPYIVFEPAEGSIVFTNIYNKEDPNPVKYTVSYNANGGVNPPAGSEYAAGDEFYVSGPGSMTRNGYKFAGWSYNYTTYGPGTAFRMPQGNVIFEAIWDNFVIPPPITTAPRTTTSGEDETTTGEEPTTSGEDTTEPSIIEITTEPESEIQITTEEEPPVEITEATQPAIEVTEPETVEDYEDVDEGNVAKTGWFFNEDTGLWEYWEDGVLIKTSATDPTAEEVKDEQKESPKTGDLVIPGILLAMITTIAISVVVTKKRKEDAE